MTAQHTPGPWIINPYAERSVIAPVFATGPKAIAMLQGRIQGRDEIREANGRLIAAAPELLEACKLAERWLESWASAEPYLATIRTAITKATGCAA